ncbi:MAG: T9SS type A sorting domain-containing protein [Polaribacter sp.]|nr:T9SS type A sorting domain-containing protein [Polaribacter sp.]
MYSGGPTDGEVFTIQMEANGVVRVTDNNQNFVRMNDMPLTIGAWNHVVVTVPSTNTLNSIQLYKNGVASTENYTGTNPLINTASTAINFFSRYKGLASDIRFFNYKLCGTEVESVFNDRRTSLSIDNNLIDETLKVYPTLVTSSVFFSKPIQSIKVVNMLGKTFVSKSKVNLTELDLSHLSTGVYILQINQNQMVKILKN